MFIDLETIKAAEHLFRDYDGELQFIRNMYWLGEVHSGEFCVISRGDNPQIVGLFMLFQGEAVNTNKFGEV